MHYVTDVLYPMFKNWEAKSWYDITYQTGQVAHLELVLNDRFDPILKRIFIGPGIYPPRVYIYTAAEQKPLYIYTAAENQPVYMYSEGEYINGVFDFVVNVPNGLPYEETSIAAVVDRYKRDGKNYKIQYF